MAYKSMRECVDDLERHGHLERVREEVDPYLEMAEIQRNLYAAKGPAVLFERVKGSPFPAVCNLFGTLDRSRFIFRGRLTAAKHAIVVKADPAAAAKTFWRYLGVPWTGLMSLPQRTWNAPVLECETTIGQLPQIKCWPMDGGAFITLPQVYSEDPNRPGVMNSNIGMYRIQLGGNDYVQGKEIGLHYQIHRGIGVHHAAAIHRQEPLRVAVFVGGPPAHTFAAVMPLPEGLPEVVFAGMLAGRRFRWAKYQDWTVSADADFCIIGTIDPRATKPEGPFGDHLGYYSLTHNFPVMKVERVFHRRDAIWPFTVVGRPPQEDTSFGALIHDLTKPMVPVSLPGVKAMHAVDVAGVHPLLLAIGSERYVPYGQRVPQEILTEANAILGFNQASLAKYLLIAACEDNPSLNVHDEARFVGHILERVDWTRDLHFYTKTTMDTLDYSGVNLNEGSKVVIAAAGSKRRDLMDQVPASLVLPSGFSNPRISVPGVLVAVGPKFESYGASAAEFDQWCGEHCKIPQELPLVVIVDDADFCCASVANWFWVTFTRSDPARDIYGVDSFMEHKHWGARGSLIIDARIKPHHAPPLIEDPDVTKRVQEKFGNLWNKREQKK